MESDCMKLLVNAIHSVITGAVFILISGVVQADMPEGEYACQVLTKSARVGITLVQADDRQTATAVAARSMARNFSGVQESASTVVQCIRLPSERFSDTDVQRLFERTGG